MNSDYLKFWFRDWKLAERFAKRFQSKVERNPSNESVFVRVHRMYEVSARTDYAEMVSREVE